MGGPGDTADQPKGPTVPWGGSEGMNARRVQNFSPLFGVARLLMPSLAPRNRGALFKQYWEILSRNYQTGKMGVSQEATALRPNPLPLSQIA